MQNTKLKMGTLIKTVYTFKKLINKIKYFLKQLKQNFESLKYLSGKLTTFEKSGTLRTLKKVGY